MAKQADEFMETYFSGLTPEERARFKNQIAPAGPDFSQFLQPQQAAPTDWRDVPEMQFSGGGASGNAHSPAPPIGGPRPAAPGPVNLAAMFPAPAVGPSATPSTAPKSAPVPWNAPKAKDAAPAPPIPMKDAAKQFAKQDREENLKGATFAEPDESVTSAKPGALGPMVSKGGRTPHSWQVQEGLELPETIEAYGNARNASMDAAGAARDAGQLDAIRQMGYLERFEKSQDERAMRLKWQAEDRARRYDAEIDKFGQLTEAVRGDKIDPSAFFTKNGTAGAFAASVAYMLGAVGGALTRTENPVIGVIRDEIDAQKKNAVMRRERIEDQKGLLGQLTRTFGDEAIGEQAAWAAYLEKAKTQMAQIAATSQYESVRVKYKQAVADIEENVGKMTDALVKSGIPEAREDLNRLLSSIPKEGSVPGIGGVSNFVPDTAYNWVGSTHGQEIRQAAAVLFNRQLKSEAGAAVSDQELERQKQAFYGAKDAASARRTLIAYGNRLNALEGTIRSRADARVNEIQRERQGQETRRLDKRSGFTGPKSE